MKTCETKKMIEMVMEAKGWKRADVARYLGITRANITNYLNGSQNMSNPTRKLIEMELQRGYEE